MSHQAAREDAMSILRRLSRRSQRSLHEVATDVVRSESHGRLDILGADEQVRPSKVRSLTRAH
jgi:hypothetical protein